MSKPTAQQIRNILTDHLSGEDRDYDRATNAILGMIAGKSHKRTTYTVIVGNLGTTHTGTNKRAAMKEYRDYVDASIATHGIIKGEDVTLCANGEPIKEHQGNQENRA